jgi:sugar O-acyltransferase (sialic acid O-acetyltransferase NeuD family)
LCARSSELRAVGLGAGGHAAVVIEALRARGGIEIVALTDPREELWGTAVLGVPVVGGDDQLQQYHRAVSHAFIGLGGASDTGPRRQLFELALSHRFELVDVIHPSALVSPSARVGRGVILLANAVVNANVELGENVLVNTAAVVEHDCAIADHVHIATGARLASRVIVETGAHVGPGAVVLQTRTVGAGAIVGAGAVVTRDVEPGTVVGGVPARPLEREQA